MCAALSQAQHQSLWKTRTGFPGGRWCQICPCQRHETRPGDPPLLSTPVWGKEQVTFRARCPRRNRGRRRALSCVFLSWRRPPLRSRHLALSGSRPATATATALAVDAWRPSAHRYGSGEELKHLLKANVARVEAPADILRQSGKRAGGMRRELHWGKGAAAG